MDYEPEKQAVIDRINFREADHRYVLDGMRIPSVTQCIEWLLPYADLDPTKREEYLLRGDLVHKLTALDDTDQLGEDEETMDDIRLGGLLGYLEAWQRFKHDFSPEFAAIEQRVYNMAYRYTGTCDRVAVIQDKPWLLEIKTGSHTNGYRLQTAAYMAALNELRLKPPIQGRMAVVLRDTGHYTTYEHQDFKGDFAAFCAAMTLQNWRAKNGY